MDLEKEPENIHDENAIAVYVQTEGAWYKVGYIASELTQYVSLTLMCVKHIKLRTTAVIQWVLSHNRSFEKRLMAS